MGGGCTDLCPYGFEVLENASATSIPPVCYVNPVHSIDSKSGLSTVDPGFVFAKIYTESRFSQFSHLYKMTDNEPSELVSIFSEACPNFRLTIRGREVVLAEKDPEDQFQLWRKIEVGKDNGWFFDKAGQPGFILINQALHLPLKHGYQVNDLVTLHENLYREKYREGTIIWSQGKNEGQGYRAIRPVTDISLNLDIAGISKKNRVVKDGSCVILSAWDKKKTNLRWKLQPEPEHEPETEPEPEQVS